MQCVRGDARSRVDNRPHVTGAAKHLQTQCNKLVHFLAHGGGKRRQGGAMRHLKHGGKLVGLDVRCEV